MGELLCMTTGVCVSGKYIKLDDIWKFVRVEFYVNIMKGNRKFSEDGVEVNERRVQRDERETENN